MGIAACFNCGHIKRGPFHKCPECGKDPKMLDVHTKAVSLYLSSDAFDPELVEEPDPARVRRFSEQIRVGKGVEIDPETLAKLMKIVIEIEQHPVPWWKVLVFLIVCILPAVVTLFVWLILW